MSDFQKIAALFNQNNQMLKKLAMDKETLVILQIIQNQEKTAEAFELFINALALSIEKLKIDGDFGPEVLNLFNEQVTLLNSLVPSIAKLDAAIEAKIAENQ